MTDTQLLRTTLEALDDFVDGLQRGSGRTVGITSASDVGPRFVIDEGRAAAEWALEIDLDGDVERIGLLVVCDVDDDRLSDARLYVAVRPHTHTKGMDR